MKETGKQIDYAFETLNEEFFSRLKSCQILHLRPKLYNQDFQNDNDILRIEDQYLKEVEVDQN